MDTSFNTIDINDNFEEEIRLPDKVVKEQLTEHDTRSDFDREMEEAIYLSMQEVREHEINNEKYEKEVIHKYHLQTTERRDKFHDLLLTMNKLFKFDKDIKEISNIIEPIIEAYCLDYIQLYELDEETYDRIFKVLGSIRTNKSNIDHLKTIIIKVAI
jgi:hypothetical protein